MRAAEIEVDQDTGAVRVVRIVAAHDLGRTLNPLLAAGQVEGAVVQALGYAMNEEMIFQDGRLQNPSFLDYRMPTINDIPAIETVFIDSGDPVGPFGAKGVAEPAAVPTPAAISNAFYHATRVPVTSLPMNPERLWSVIRTKNGVARFIGRLP